SPEHARRLERDILAGVPLGQAVARFNAHPVSRDRQYRVCLFGDPELTLTHAAAKSASASAPVAARASVSQDMQGVQREVRQDLAALQLLRLSMGEAERTAGGASLATAARRAVRAAQAAEQAHTKGIPSADSEGDTLTVLRESVL